MYLIDKPLYAIEMFNGYLAIDNSTDQEVYVTFCRKFAERELRHHIGGKIVIYSDYIKRGDDFPVLGGQPLPEDLI